MKGQKNNHISRKLRMNRKTRRLLLAVFAFSLVAFVCFRVSRPVKAAISVSRAGVAPNFVVTFNNDGNPPVDNSLQLQFNPITHNLEYSINGGPFTSDLGGGNTATFANITTIVTNFGAGSNTLSLNLQTFAFNVSVVPDFQNTQQLDTTLQDTGSGHVINIATTSAKVIHFSGSGGDDNLTINSGQGDNSVRIDNGATVFTDEVTATDMPSVIEFANINNFTYTDAGFGTNTVTFATQNLAGASSWNANLDTSDDTLIIEGAEATNDNFTMTRPVAGQVRVTDNTPSPAVAVTLTQRVGGPTPPGVRVDGLGGNDTLNINVAGPGSDVIPNTITFDGGTGSNLLNIQGSPTTSVNRTIYSPGPETGEGTLVYQDGGGTPLMSVGFVNLSPVHDNVPAVLTTVNGTNADNAMNYVQGPGGGIFTGNTGLVSVDNLETYEFNNKTNLVINGLAGNDTINLNNQTVPAGLSGTITVNGGDPTAGSDTLIVNGRVNATDTFTYTPAATTSDTGSVSDTGLPTVAFTTIEHLIINGQNGGPGSSGDSLAINTSNLSSGQTEILTPGTTFDSGHVDFRDRPGGVNPTAVPLDFKALGVAGSLSFTDSGRFDNLIYNGTPLNDTFTVNAAGVVTLNDQIPVSTSSIITLTLSGLGGNDTFNVAANNNLPSGVVVQGGNPSANNVNYTAPANVATTVDLRVGTISSTGSAPFAFSGVATVNEVSSGPNSSLTIQGSTGPQNLVYSPDKTTGTGAGNLSGFGAIVNFSGVGQPITFNGHDPAARDALIANSQGDNLVLEPTAQNAGTVNYFLVPPGKPVPGINFTGIGGLKLVGTAVNPLGIVNPFGIDGTPGDDHFEYIPGATPDTGTIVGTMNSGIAQFPLVPVTFTGMQQGGVVVFNTFGQQGGTDSFVFNGTPSDDQISMNNGGVFGGVTLSDTVNGALFANLNLNNMNGGVTVQGNDGDDVFTHDPNIQIPVTYSGGNHAAGNTLNFTALANAATTIDFGASTINSTGSGVVNFVGVTTINEASSGAGQSLTVNGTSSGDNISFTPTGANAGTVTLAGLNPVVKFSGVPTLGLNGLDGNDFFSITPSSSVTVNVAGGNPTPPASPGDSITVNTAGTTGYALSDTSGPTGLAGSFTFTNRNPVNFSQIETLSPLRVSSTTLAAVEGVPFSNAVVANFNGAAGATSNFNATINWGDGTASSNGVITSVSPGAFNVQGGHTYTEEGSYNATVNVTDLTTSASQQVTTSANVADAPLGIAPQSAGSSSQFSGVGGTNVSGGAFNAMSAFQTAIGGVNNGGTASPQNGGFRTINWDGVLLNGTDFGGATITIVPNKIVGIPPNRFQERGTLFDEVYAVSGDGFVSANPSAAGQFPAFSPNNTFAMFNDNVIDFNFVLPSVHTTTPLQAVSRGFGAIFLDVETPNTTSIEYFNGTTSLGKFFVPTGPSAQPEFFGVLFQNPVVTHVEITLGNAQLFSFDGENVTPGGLDNPPASDLAVTDDFVYAEPTAVPTGINLNTIIGVPLTARVATFTDADPAGQVSDYTAIIGWGDGTSSAGTITPNPSGGFDVTGTHSYTGTGTFTITTSITDIGGSNISAASTVNVSALPSLSVTDMTVIEPASGGTTNAGFNVTLSAPSTQPITVDFSTADGTANAPADYQSVAGTLTFAPGVTTRTINVTVNGDSAAEADESHFSENFFVNLVNPNGASILKAQGVGTINRGDATSIFQFSSPTTTVNENANPDSVALTVTRTGDTSAAASVHFETSDGTATQKSKYIFNSGTLQWGVGDAAPKTISVLLVNEAFVEGNKTFTVTLSNPSPTTAIGNPDTATVTIVDDDTVPPVANPIDSAQFFVRQHYLDFLGREPDAAGLNFWAGQITACGANPSCIAAARVNVSAAFFLSIEYQETSGAVVRLQRVGFGKFSADPASRVSYLQFMRDTRQVGAGVVVGQPGFDTLLEQNKQAYALQLVNSPAFLARFPILPGAQFVDALSASAGLTPTTAERTAAINAFGGGGTLGRVAALRSIADSNTVRQAEMMPAFVLAEYFGYLRRNPTDAPDFNDAGYQFWLAKLIAFNGDFVQAQMVQAFITSSEFRQRFGP
jgi:hypothetical protein